MRAAQGGGKWFGAGDERVIIDPEFIRGGDEKRKTTYAINGDFLDIFLQDGGEGALKRMLSRPEAPCANPDGETYAGFQDGGDYADNEHDYELYSSRSKWCGNEVDMRIKRFEVLLDEILGEDVEFDDLGEKVEKCVGWLAGVMVELL